MVTNCHDKPKNQNPTYCFFNLCFGHSILKQHYYYRLGVYHKSLNFACEGWHAPIRNSYLAFVGDYQFGNIDMTT